MKTEDGKIVFDEDEQKEVDRIVGERLSREGVRDMKETLDTLKAFGYEGTPAEIKAAVRADAEAYSQQMAEIIKQEELDALKEQAKDKGTTPELLAEIKELKAELSEIKGERQAVKQTAQQQAAARAAANAQVKYFKEHDDTKDVDLVLLRDNPKFQKFLSKRVVTEDEDFLTEAYKDFVEFVGDAEAKAIAKINANVSRSTSGGRDKGDAGSTYGLTSEEISTVDDWNKKNPHMKMSYKEFSQRK